MLGCRVSGVGETDAAYPTPDAQPPIPGIAAGFP